MFYLMFYIPVGIIFFLAGFLIAKLLVKKTTQESLGWGVVAFMVLPILHFLSGFVRGDERLQQELFAQQTIESRPKPTPAPDLEVNQGEVVGREHPLHHGHEKKKPEVKPEPKPEHHHLVPRKPEAEKFHPVRKVFRASVEGLCGILGFPGWFSRFIGVIEICALVFVLSIVLGVVFLGLRLLGVTK